MVGTLGDDTDGAEMARRYNVSIVVSENNKVGQVRGIDGDDLPSHSFPLTVPNYTASGIAVRVATLPAVPARARSSGGVVEER